MLEVSVLSRCMYRIVNQADNTSLESALGGTQNIS
jgi:hypothetical protein